MGGGQAMHIVEEGRNVIGGLQLVDEVGNAGFVDAPGHVGVSDQRLRVGGAGEQSARREVIGQLPHPDLVARGEQAAVAGGPDDEGEVAEQAFGASGPPPEIGGYDDCAVTHHAVGGVDAERRDQIVAVVDPRIGGDQAPGRAVAQRHGLGQRFGAGRIERVA